GASSLCFPPMDVRANPKSAVRSRDVPFERWMSDQRRVVDRALADYVRHELGAARKYSQLGAAVEYALDVGGKRIRPILTLEFERICGANRRAALSAATAIEFVHTFSLIHDDLPAMDNDDLRRGKPTVHKKFGEAIAILTGDWLLAQAFECAIQATGIQNCD